MTEAEYVATLPASPDQVAREEILRILAERYLRSLTPGTNVHTELNRLMVTAGLWRPPLG